MREKNPSQIGLETELKCQSYLLNKGFDILVPLGNYLKYDLVIVKDNKFYRIQIKHSHEKCENSFAINTRYDQRIQGRVTKQPYKIEDLDYFMTEYNGVFYMFPVFGTVVTRLWLNHNGLNQPTKKYAEDYLAENILLNL